jgi:hypothetical protein
MSGGRGWRPVRWRGAALLVALGVLLAALAGPAGAQAPPRERQFVYGLNLFDGADYAASYAPASVDTLYVLADHESVIDPRRTDVYYWPITNEYRADFAALNELVPGTLEIEQGGRAVAALPLTEYVVQVDQAKQRGRSRLATGPAARELYARFERERAAHVEQLHTHSQANEEYLRRRQAGDTAAQPPPAPPPFTLFSTAVNQGFAIRLPAGEYRIRVRDTTGAVVPGSERRLVAMTPRRQGIGYEVVPQEKWTFPERASDPSSVLYTVPGGVVYLQPYTALEFNALEYARLQNPQDLKATPNRWTWVHVAPVDGATLVVEGDGQREQIRQEGFLVEQAPGPALGYVVKPLPAPAAAGAAAEARAPDIVGFRGEAPAGRATLRLWLVDAAGRPLAGSERELVVNPAVPDWLLLLPVAAPLAAGLGAVLWRRRQVATRRSLRPEQRQLLA